MIDQLINQPNYYTTIYFGITTIMAIIGGIIVAITLD